MERGWVKLFRRITDNPVWEDPVLLKVWLWILLTATHKSRPVPAGPGVIELGPGQFVRSLRKAAEETGIPKSTLERKLKVLERRQMVTVRPVRNPGHPPGQKAGHLYSLFTVANWDTYQAGPSESGTPNGTPRGTAAGQERDGSGPITRIRELENERKNPQPGNRKPVEDEGEKEKLETLKPQRKFSWLQLGRQARKEIGAYADNNHELKCAAATAVNKRLASGERIRDRAAAILVEIDRIRNASEDRPNRTEGAAGPTETPERFQNSPPAAGEKDRLH